MYVVNKKSELSAKLLVTALFRKLPESVLTAFTPSVYGAHMTYSPAPATNLVTPFGTFQMVATGADSVRLLLRYEGADDFIIVNGVKYHASLDLMAYDDNADDAPFSPKREYYGQGENRRYHVGHSLSMNRVDNYKDASDAAKRKVLKVVTDLVNAFVLSEEGRTLLVNGGDRKFAVRIESKERELREAEAKVAALREELAELRAAEASWKVGV